MAPDDGQFRIDTFLRLLGQFPTGRLVDLGAGHGLFSTKAAEQGWQVTAVDARTERFPDNPGVTWVNQDVRETNFDEFDVIANLGLFYHLDAKTQVELLDRAQGTPMILDTHIGVEGAEHALSDVVEQEGYRGRLYHEEPLQGDARSSWENAYSFWAEPDEQVRMLDDRGWDVFTLQPFYRKSRTFFLCLPR